MDGSRQPVIPGYDVVRRLGGGADGTVWLVQPLAGGPLRAAKHVPPGGVLTPGTDSPDPSASGSGTPQDAAGETKITGEFRILSNYDHEHLLSPIALVNCPDGGRALIVDYAAGGSVRGLVGCRGRLGIGEVVTVLTPLAQVLAYLHGQGVVHGDVSPANVLLTANGKPLLADLGLGRVLGQPTATLLGTDGFAAPDADSGAAGDVYAAGAVGWFALTGAAPQSTADRPPLATLVPGVPRELVAALEAALAEDPQQRPTAAAFAQAVYRSARAEPLDLAMAVHPSVLPDLPTRRQARNAPRSRRLHRLPFRGAVSPEGRQPALGARRRDGARGGGRKYRRLPGTARWFPVALAGLAVLVLAGFGSVAVRAMLPPALDPVEPPAATTPPPDPRPEPLAALPAEVVDQLRSSDPARALAGLAWLRTQALATGQFDLLADTNAPQSPALAHDAGVVAELTRTGHTLTGLDVTVGKTTIVGSPAAGGTAGTKAVVDATVSTGAYAEQDAAGVVVHQAPAPPPRRLRFVLVRQDDRWRILQILAAP